MATSETKTHVETTVDSVLNSFEKVRAEGEAVIDQTRRVVVKADRTLKEKMRQNPLLVLGIALGVGYMAGRLYSKFR